MGSCRAVQAWLNTHDVKLETRNTKMTHRSGCCAKPKQKTTPKPIFLLETKYPRRISTWTEPDKVAVAGLKWDSKPKTCRMREAHSPLLSTQYAATYSCLAVKLTWLKPCHFAQYCGNGDLWWNSAKLLSSPNNITFSISPYNRCSEQSSAMNGWPRWFASNHGHSDWPSLHLRVWMVEGSTKYLKHRVKPTLRDLPHQKLITGSEWSIWWNFLKTGPNPWPFEWASKNCAVAQG